MMILKIYTLLAADTKWLFELLLEVLGIIAWPFILLICIILIKKHIVYLLGSKKLQRGEFSLSHSGMKVAVEMQKRPKKRNTVGKSIELEKLKKKNKKKYKELNRRVNSYQKLSEELINILTTKEIELDFERIYNIIFGTQILLLQSIKENGCNNKKDLTTFFNLAKQIYPPLNSWDLQMYLCILLSKKLIYVSKGKYFITDKGKAFLFYIDFWKYPVNKGL